MKTIPEPEALLAFESLARLGSFTAAAGERGCAKSHISQLIRQLESDLQCVLLIRSTRRIALTEAGEKLLPHTISLREMLHQIRPAIEDIQPQIEGELMISTTPSMAQYMVGPLLVEFARIQPKLRIRVDANGRIQDPVLEGLDFCIRTGHVGDERLIGRLLGYSLEKLYASPAYLGSQPPIRTPADLAQHATLINDDYQASRQWILQNGDQKQTLDLNPVLCSNNNPTLARIACAGHGVVLLPHLVGEHYHRQGQLRPILPDWHEKATPVYLVYPYLTHMPRKYRAFLDYMLPAMRCHLYSQDKDGKLVAPCSNQTPEAAEIASLA